MENNKQDDNEEMSDYIMSKDNYNKLDEYNSIELDEDNSINLDEYNSSQLSKDNYIKLDEDNSSQLNENSSSSLNEINSNNLINISNNKEHILTSLEEEKKFEELVNDYDFYNKKITEENLDFNIKKKMIDNNKKINVSNDSILYYVEKPVILLSSNILLPSKETKNYKSLLIHRLKSEINELNILKEITIDFSLKKNINKTLVEKKKELNNARFNNTF